ncbi:MAG: cytochrome c biogenesis protein CcdA [Candidatus Hodarchaeales archaeon]|jgi:cytochrome c biogenesis protein CcdA
MYIFGLFIDDSIGLPLFFLAGLYVALSPCLFPIMPLTIFRIMNKDVTNSEGNAVHPSRFTALKWVSILVSGILVTFIGVALIIMYLWVGIATQIQGIYRPFSFLLGVLLIIMGIFILYPKLSEKTFAKIPIPMKISNLMAREEYKQMDLFLIGFGYSFIALPCAFSVFYALILIIIKAVNPVFTLTGLSLFSLGLFIPYFILVFVTAEARVRAAQYLAEKFRLVELIMGVLIIIFGLLFIWPSFGGPELFELTV